MPATSKTINALADDIEALAGTGDGIWSLRIDLVELDERRLLISTHGRIISVLRSRGHRVRADRVTNDTGDYMTIRIVSRRVQSVESRLGLA